MAICGALEPRQLADFSALASHVSFKPGQTICEEGGPAEWVYSVTRGVVGLHKALPDGRRQTTGFLFDGDFVGLASRAVNVCGAEAVTAVEVCRFSRPRFEAYLEVHPELRERLLRMTADELSAAHQHILLLGRKSARERVASFLLQFVDRATGRGLTANPLSLPMKRAAIADHLGLTIETVSRTFTSLAHSGMIEMISPSLVRIVSVSGLREAAGDR